MSKIIQTQTEYVCLAANPATTPNANVVAHYSANMSQSVAQSYGLIRGLAYKATQSVSLETVTGVPVGANLRIFNTMAATNLAVVLSCYAAVPTTSLASITLSVPPGGVLSVPSNWRTQTFQIGQTSQPTLGTTDTAPFAVPTNCVVFWWL